MFLQKPLCKAIALTGVMAFPCLFVPMVFSQEPNIEDFDFEGFLGGNVWEDENENGFQGSRSAPEQGIEDVSVTLTDDQGKPLQTTTTNKNGFYYFRGLEEGDYSVQFERPENCEFTKKDRYNQYDPRFDYWDSDADNESGAGQTIRIDREHRFDFTSDAGIIFDEFPTPKAPILYPDAVTLNVGETIEVDVLANDQLNGDIDEFFIDDRTFPGKVEIAGSLGDNGLVVVTADFLDGEFGVPYSVVVNGQLVTSKLWVTIEKPATLAVDDQVSAFVGDQITVDVLANDIISEAVDVVRILGTDVPGRVFINRTNNLVVRDTRATGGYTVEYEVISTDGSRSTALVEILLEERPVPTVANDDTASGVVNKPLIVNILKNDQPSKAVASVEIVGSDLPDGEAFINDDGDLVIENVTQAGTYTVEYDLYSTSGSADNAIVTVTLKEPTPEPIVDPVPEKAPEPEKPARDPNRAPKACAVPNAFTSFASVVYVIEPNKDEFAPSYRLYGASGDFLGQFDVTYSADGWITTGGVMRQERYSSIVKAQDRKIVYSISSVMNGIESPRVNCALNNHSTPIAIDIDNNGKIERIQGEFHFDFNGDGKQTTISQWFGAQEGILVDNRFQGEITGKHLFGDQGGHFADGYAKLAMLDSDNNGWIEGIELNHLGIWTDTNSNTKVDGGELSTLADHKIVSLNTTHINYLSKAKLANGQTLLSEDVWFPMTASAAESSAFNEAELTVSKSRLPIVLSVLAIIFSSFTAAGWFYRRKSKA